MLQSLGRSVFAVATLAPTVVVRVFFAVFDRGLDAVSTFPSFGCHESPEKLAESAASWRKGIFLGQTARGCKTLPMDINGIELEGNAAVC